jgi:hypothetical protein
MPKSTKKPRSSRRSSSEGGHAKKSAATTPPKQSAAPPPSEKESSGQAHPPRQFSTARDLFSAIAKERDLADVGVALLGDEGKGATVRARMFETSVEYLFGKPRSAPDPGDDDDRFNIIWDIPAPSRETL